MRTSDSPMSCSSCVAIATRDPSSSSVSRQETNERRITSGSLNETALGSM